MRDNTPGRFAFIGLALLLPWVTLLQKPHPINVDASWFFYVARGVLQGGMLYRDYIEPNAPLASLSLTPAVLLGRALAIRADMAVELVVLAYAAISLALCAAVLQRMRIGRRTLVGMLLTLDFGFVVLPKAFFGQREHILAMLLAPYVLGCAALCGGYRLPRGLGCAVGVAAAVAVGLKPPFVLIPAVLEAAIVLQAGPRAAWRAQTLAMATALAVVTAATLIFFPLYTTQVVPWATALYGGYNQPEVLWSNLACAIFACALIWFNWTTRADGWSAPIRLCLAASVIGGLTAFAAQGKGWIYQACPAWLYLFLMTVGAIASGLMRPGASILAATRLLGPGLVAMLFALFLAFGPTTSADMTKFAAISAAVSAEPGPFLILSTNVLPAFPMALLTDRVWASRTPCMIMLPGLVEEERRGKISPWERTFRNWIAADMLTYRPKLVFIPPKGDEGMPSDFDNLAWLLRDSGFAAIWAQYHDVGVLDGFRVFRRS